MRRWPHTGARLPCCAPACHSKSAANRILESQLQHKKISLRSRACVISDTPLQLIGASLDHAYASAAARPRPQARDPHTTAQASKRTHSVENTFAIKVRGPKPETRTIQRKPRSRTEHATARAQKKQLRALTSLRLRPLSEAMNSSRSLASSESPSLCTITASPSSISPFTSTKS
jgi:hypothetical protein